MKTKSNSKSNHKNCSNVYSKQKGIKLPQSHMDNMHMYRDFIDAVVSDKKKTAKGFVKHSTTKQRPKLSKKGITNIKNVKNVKNMNNIHNGPGMKYIYIVLMFYIII